MASYAARHRLGSLLRLPAPELPDDRPRPHDAQPPHRLPRREAVRAHQPQRDELSGPAQAV